MRTLFAILLGVFTFTAGASGELPPFSVESYQEPVPMITLQEAWTVNLYFENDLFANTDENYTNGTKLSLVSGDLAHYRDNKQLPKWTHGIIDILPFIHEEGYTRNVVFSLGQNMYTPKDISAFNYIPTDRPYAGWLYFSVGFQAKNENRMDIMEVNFGIVGPWSLGETMQDFVHSLREIPKANGWDNQLRNEPTLNLFWGRRHRLFEHNLTKGVGVDAIAGYGAALGNAAIYAKLDGEARLGWNLPADFGAATIRFGGDTSAPASASDPRLRGDWGAYLFAGLDLRAIARDIFLDGNTFRDSASIEKEPFVASFGAGASIVAGSWKLTYTQIYRTKQFELQARPHAYGSISVSYTF